jgi:NAD(P)-dependent dehydrogenase (short-subunit alcohol dehydrogenase family)
MLKARREECATKENGMQRKVFDRKVFDRKLVVITGGCAGIGRALAVRMAQAGARLVIFHLQQDPLDGLVQHLADHHNAEALGLCCDVSDAEAVQRAIALVVERFGGIDVLINNAGILRDKTFAKMSTEDFRAVVDVHLIGSANATKAVWEAMRGQNYGRILMTSSTSGVYGNFGQSNYGAAKAGLIGLMNVLHFEGARYGIKVNAVLPTAATRMTGDMMDEEMLHHLAPENVVPAALFLVGEEAPSRVARLAGAGTVARMAIVESQGVYLPAGKRTPEAVAEAFATISSLDGSIETEAGLAHVDRIIANARTAVAKA